jgi:alkylation response protein AidB-like acyl-CoA dehydrogenase
MYLDLNVDLTETEIALKEQAHRFAAEVTRPASLELDKLANPEDVIAKDSILWDVFRQYYALGHQLGGFPEELGGVTMSALGSAVISEEMGWGSADFAIGLGVAGMPYRAALFVAQLSGNEQLMDELVAPFTQDKEAKYVGCWAITEPQHGSDTLMAVAPEFGATVSYLDTRGKLDGTDWIINGAKSAWVSNGTIATHALVHMAVDRPGPGTSGCIAFVPLDLPGVSRGKPLNKIGQRALNQGEIYFDNVRIPGHYILMPPELYTFASELILALANGGMGPTFTGVARAAFEEAMGYCKQRVQGGKPLCEHQLVQRKLFDMFIKVESARQLSRAVLVYNSAQQLPLSRYSVASKVYCTQVAFDVASDAVQLFGGMGLSKGTLVEKLFRDARTAMIEDGANDALALAVAPQLISSYL